MRRAIKERCLYFLIIRILIFVFLLFVFWEGVMAEVYAPELIFPLQDAVFSSAPTFSWNNAGLSSGSSEVKYRFLISESPDFSTYEFFNWSIIEGEEITVFNPPVSLIEGKSYYWKVQAYVVPEVDEEAIAVYDFDYDLLDRSGELRDWIHFGPVRYTAGNIGAGLYFDNYHKKTYAKIPTAGMSFLEGSIEIWASFEDTHPGRDNEQAYMVSHRKVVGGDGGRIYIRRDSPIKNGHSNFTVALGNNCDIESNFNILEDDIIHQYVITWNSTNLNAYVDGTKVLDNEGYTGLSSLDDYLYIGNHRGEVNPQQNWTGVIDSIRIYNRALEQDLIVEHYDSYKVVESEVRKFNYSSCEEFVPSDNLNNSNIPTDDLNNSNSSDDSSDTGNNVGAGDSSNSEGSSGGGGGSGGSSGDGGSRRTSLEFVNNSKNFDAGNDGAVVFYGGNDSFNNMEGGLSNNSFDSITSGAVIGDEEKGDDFFKKIFSFVVRPFLNLFLGFFGLINLF